MRRYCLYVIFKLWSGICGTWKTKNQTKYIIFAFLTKFSAKFCSQVNFYKALSITALHYKGVYLGLKSAKPQELFSCLHQHIPNGELLPGSNTHCPTDPVQAVTSLPNSNKLIWCQQVVIWLHLFLDFNLSASRNESTIWLLSQWKGSQPNMTFTRPQLLAPDFNIHYYSDQKNHRNHLSFYCSLTHFTQSCSEQNHRWTSGHTESTTTTLDMKRKFY